MTARLLSAIYVMLDAFIISIVLVFVSNESVLSVVWSWLLAVLMMSCTSYFLFRKHSYRLVWVVGISIVATLAMWTVGVSLWLALILGMIAIYLLHTRYSVLYEEFNHSYHFLTKFLVVFSVCWVVLLANPEEQKSGLLFTIVPVAVLFYVASHLLYGYIHTKAEGTRFRQVAGAFGILAALPTFAAIGTFWIADEVRSFIGWAVGGVISVLLWPLALLLEQVTEFLSGLSTEEEMQETLNQLGPDAETVHSDPTVSEAMPTDFPVEIFFGLAVLVGAIALALWLRKIKPVSHEQMPKSSVSIKRHNHLSSEKLAPCPVASNGQKSDLHHIREVFRSLEMLAKEQQSGRKDYETVREWLKRMKWDVTDSFSETYDQVRYGDKQLPDVQAREFINEIAEIKSKYLKENV